MSNPIKDLREQAGLKREELANRVGVSLSAIQKYEIDALKPSLEVILKIGKELEEFEPLAFQTICEYYGVDFGFIPEEAKPDTTIYLDNTDELLIKELEKLSGKELRHVYDIVLDITRGR